MALSRVIRTGDGTTVQFVVDFALGYISEDDVTCRVGDEEDGGGNPVYRTITWIDPTTAQISGAAPGNGVDVVFDRTIEKETKLVNFSDGDVLDELNLDIAFSQILMAVHETLDGRFEALSADLGMGGFKVVNMGDPTVAQDAATKAYVDANNSSTEAAAAAASAASAADSASAAASSSSAAATSASNASASASNALASENLAQQWASEAEDVVVSGGMFSAFHWAQKAEEFAAAIGDASTISFDNSGTGVAADNVQDALVELDAELSTAYTDIATNATDITALDAKVNWTQASVISFASGTSKSLTGIPSGVNEVDLFCFGLLLSGNDSHAIQLGIEAGLVSDGYVGDTAVMHSSTTTIVTSTSHFGLYSGGTSRPASGLIRLRRSRDDGHKWSIDGVLYLSSTRMVLVGGQVDIGGPLTQLGFSIVGGGANTYAGGTIEPRYR